MPFSDWVGGCVAISLFVVMIVYAVLSPIYEWSYTSLRWCAVILVALCGYTAFRVSRLERQ